MILLLNFAVMSDEGVYTLKQISADTYKKSYKDPPQLTTSKVISVTSKLVK